MKPADLRKLAKGKPCLVRIPTVCNHDPATTVLAHIRMAGTCGMGLKPPDTCAAWCCSACHDLIDGRARVKGMIAVADIERAARDGVLRTLAALDAEGYRMVKV